MADDNSDTILDVGLCADEELRRRKKQQQNSVQEKSP